MSRPAILRDGYPVSSLRNEGEFIVTNPPEYAAGTYFIKIVEAVDSANNRRIIREATDFASGERTIAVLTTSGYSPPVGLGGEVNTAANVGAGVGLANGKSGSELLFKTLVAGTNITLTAAADEITIDAAGGGIGETNTGSNVNTGGVGVFKQKTGTTLEFRGISAASSKATVALDSPNNLITVDVIEANLNINNQAGSIDLGGPQATGTLDSGRFNDTAHGARSGGTLHAAASTSAAGFMTAADKTKLDGIAPAANQYVHPDHTGDVSSSGDGATTIGANKVSNDKLADMTTATFKGRITAGTGDPEDLTVTQAKTLLNLAGSNTGDQTINLTGDVTGSGTGTFATAVADGAVSNAKLANMATQTIKGRTAAGAGAPEDLTPTQARAVLNVADGANNYVHPNHSGDVTSAGDGAVTIAAGVVTNAKLADMATQTLKGRSTTGTGTPEDLTPAQATAMLNTFTSGAKGLVPASGGGTANFLRADGSFATPPGGSVGGADGQLQYNNAGSLAGIANTAVNNGDIVLLPQTTLPPTPSTGVKIYGRNFAGRSMPAAVGPAGINSLLQTHIGRNRVGVWWPVGNAVTAPLAIGITSPTATGTATTRTVAITNMFTQSRRLGYVSATTAGSLAGPRLAAAQFWRGNAANLGGFFMIARFGTSDAANVAGARMFVGLSNTVGAPTNVEPTLLNNSVGVAQISSSTNMYIMTRDNGGGTTSIDLGANFPANTSSVDAYELVLSAAPNGTTIGYRVERLNTGAVTSGTLSTNLPLNTTLMGIQMWRCNNATALAVGIDLMSLYIEVPY